jgi:hypothetical protein
MRRSDLEASRSEEDRDRGFWVGRDLLHSNASSERKAELGARAAGTPHVSELPMWSVTFPVCKRLGSKVRERDLFVDFLALVTSKGLEA